MNKISTIFCSVLLVFLTFANVSWAARYGIVTGSPTGTYFQIGNDLSRLMKKENLKLEVNTSGGSVDNIRDVYFRLPKAQLGIVQSDVLAYLSTRKSHPFTMVAQKIRLAFPLYNEEVHLLAKNGIRSLADLANRKVAVGKKESGTNITADTLLRIAGIKVIPVEISGEEALGALKKGEVDAMFYVAGSPVALFSDSIKEADNLKLLPVQDQKISAIYNTSSTIPSSAYQWLDKDVPTVAVKAVLISYDHKGPSCQIIGKIAKVIRNNIDWLRENGHPKWQEVDLGYEINGWTQYECVKDTVEDSGSQSEFDDLLKAISEQ
jgi:TRAP transporter TAXI family solute receptor